MKQFILTLLCVIGFTGVINAQQTPLKFHADGTFKIVQFTDVHYIYGKEEAKIAIENINNVLDAEKPDLVVITGDAIFGKPAEEGLRHVLKQISDRKIPFAYTYGNHDDEQGLTRQELLKIAQSIPYCLATTTEGISGVTNYVLPLKASANNKDAALLYIFDSNSYMADEDVKGYDYIKHDQISWYRAESKKYTEQNGGTPMPALSFFHIPLPEYAEAAASDTAKLVGNRHEKACNPKLNTGLFASMKEMGDMMGVFVGHDHDNDYAVEWYNILLAYGRYTGGNTVYNNVKPNGARVIEMIEGQRSFRTWIRLSNGKIINAFTYPRFQRLDK